MRVVNFVNLTAAGAVYSWVADVDTAVRGFDGIGLTGYLSTNPNFDATAGIGVAPNFPAQDEFLVVSGFSGGAHDFNFPISEGRRIFVSVSANIGVAQLFIEP